MLSCKGEKLTLSWREGRLCWDGANAEATTSNIKHEGVTAGAPTVAALHRRLDDVCLKEKPESHSEIYWCECIKAFTPIVFLLHFFVR